ncbi:calcium/sodium antiporter [Thermodesulfatator autotrophicus]|uniref:Sodium:calcium antiporter n=1 Tax=Thermodesulfatator autotrophicus TaxID=1795632 RepID=A0A177E7V1_9BACT|nr:calcium/sodium antiporter [Thermodesulfatator autotrophicus]OAG28033.1 sodium:calcium antiporter [Thermodesulfatator autotrophicus]
MIKDFGLVAAGIVLLYAGGEVMVQSATRLALLLGISPLVIGLTLVAFGTSAPELAATLAASFKGVGDVAFGNVIGSNIANIGLVLGLVALVSPLKTTFRFITQEMPFMLFVSSLLFLLGRDGYLGRLDGSIFLFLLVLFLFFLFKRDKTLSNLADNQKKEPLSKIILYTAGVFVSIGLLSLGANVLVEGAVNIARHLGVPERVIGLTMVAVGTSLPELVSTLVAAYRRAGDIILGNIIGSNIMNILAILGLTPIIKPFSFSKEGVTVDLSIMIFFSLMAWAMLAHQKRVGRLKGTILLGCYIFYVFYLYQ